jgi:hypothetical protein
MVVVVADGEFAAGGARGGRLCRPPSVRRSIRLCRSIGSKDAMPAGGGQPNGSPTNLRFGGET